MLINVIRVLFLFNIFPIPNVCHSFFQLQFFSLWPSVFSLLISLESKTHLLGPEPFKASFLGKISCHLCGYAVNLVQLYGETTSLGCYSQSMDGNKLEQEFIIKKAVSKLRPVDHAFCYFTLPIGRRFLQLQISL